MISFEEGRNEITLEQACSEENYSYIFRRCLYALDFDEATASDLTQDVFFALIENWKSVRNHPNLLGWLCTTADHKIADHFRYKEKSVQVENIDDPGFTEPQAEFDMLFLIDCEEINRHLDQYEAEVLSKLSAKELRLLRYIRKHMKYKDIAAELGKSAAAVSMDITRLKRKVKNLVTDIQENI